MYNKHNFAIAKVAYKDDTRPILNGVYFTGEESVATNSHLLVEVTTPSSLYLKAEKYPRIPGLPEATDSHKPFILKKEACQEIEKAIPKKVSLPILQTVAVYPSEEGYAKLAVTDLENPKIFTPRIVEGEYLKYKRFFPEEEPVIKITLSAGYLKAIAELAGNFLKDNWKKDRGVDFTFYGSSKPVKFEVKGQNQEMRGFLIPIRSPHSEEKKAEKEDHNDD